MIPQRIELRTHPYQKYALPIKLRNQISFYYKIYYILNKFKFLLNMNTKLTRALRLELRKWSLKLQILPLNYALYIVIILLMIKLYLFKFMKFKSEKRWFEHPGA